MKKKKLKQDIEFLDNVMVEQQEYINGLLSFNEILEKQMSVADKEIKRLNQIINYLEMRIDEKTLHAQDL